MAWFESYLLERRLSIGRPFVKGKVLLDYGCARAQLLKVYAEPLGMAYIGLDVDEGLLKANRLEFIGKHFINLAGLEALEDGSVDCVVMYSVFEHILYPIPVLKLLKRKLAVGGRILIITVTPKAEFFLEYMARVGATKKEWLAEHVTYWTRLGLESVVHDAGMYVSYFKYFEFGLNQFLIVERRE